MIKYRELLLKYGFPIPILYKKVMRQLIHKLDAANLRQDAIENDQRLNIGQTRIEYLPIQTYSLKECNIQAEVIHELTDKYLEHRFDILGSGWVYASYDADAVGMNQKSYPSFFKHYQFDTADFLNDLLPINYVSKSKELFDLIREIHPHYQLIDWNRDIKSGFRFDSRKWFHDSASEGNAKGVDVKMPWELCRMQHLPQLALFALHEDKHREKIILEIQAQLIDFYMVCPPNLGINWACSMDIGIRAANMLMAYNFLMLLDTQNLVSDKFKTVFAEMIEQHGVFLYQHLEFGDSITSNHYFANISGLLFISVFLERNDQTNTWLKLSAQELSKETSQQFFREGSNFEGSDSYHCLSTEMLFYSQALMESLSDDIWKTIVDFKAVQRKDAPFFDQSFNEINWGFPYIRTPLNLIISFTKSILKDNDEVPQVGDNDSGRFFKLSPSGNILSRDELNTHIHLEDWLVKYTDEQIWNENYLNHASLLSAANGLLEDAALLKYGIKNPIESYIILCLMKGEKYPYKETASISPPNSIEKIKSFPFKNEKIFYTPSSINLLENITDSHYPEFGISILRSPHFYLCIQYGTSRKGHRSWGHKHNDAGAIELQIEGKDVLIDRGTFAYTSDHAKRNEFRSTASHNTINTGIEQNEWMNTRDGLFSLLNRTKAQIIQCKKENDKYIFSLLIEYASVKHFRTIYIQSNKITIEDQCNRAFTANWNNFDTYSNGYGKLMAMKIN